MAQTNAAKERKQVMYETLGKAYYDLGKLAFAGLAIGSIVQMGKGGIDTYLTYLTVAGALSTIVFFRLGHITLRQAR